MIIIIIKINEIIFILKFVNKYIKNNNKKKKKIIYK